MKYNPGDILKVSGVHVMILGTNIDLNGVEQYKITPLYNLNSSYIYDARWIENNLLFVQKG